MTVYSSQGNFTWKTAKVHAEDCPNNSEIELGDRVVDGHLSGFPKEDWGEITDSKIFLRRHATEQILKDLNLYQGRVGLYRDWAEAKVIVSPYAQSRRSHYTQRRAGRGARDSYLVIDRALAGQYAS